MMITKKTLLVFTLSYKPDYSGAAQQLFVLLKYLKSSFCKVKVITYSHSATKPGEEIVDNILIKRFSKNSKFKFCYYLSIITYLIRETHNYDVLFINGLNKVIILCLLFINKKTKVIIRTTLYGDDDFYSLKRKLPLWFFRILLKRTHSFIAISPLLHNSFICNQVRSHLISNIVSDFTLNSHIIFKHEDDNIPDSKKINFVSAGTICMRKGIKEMIISFYNLLQNKTEIGNLYLIGPYDSHFSEVEDLYVQEIKNTIDKYSLNDKVYLLGKLTHYDTLKYFKNCNFYISFSYAEGFPNSVLEATSLGCLPITKFIDGITDYILPVEWIDFIGKINTISDFVEVLEKCVKLENNKIDYYSQICIKYIKNNFNYKKIIDTYNHLLLN